VVTNTEEAAVEPLRAIFTKRRVRLVVEVDLDPVPGWGNDPDDHRVLMQHLLDVSIGHYSPTVTIESVTVPHRAWSRGDGS
jgi:hypothetical protein